jgi:hypothetical protein
MQVFDDERMQRCFASFQPFVNYSNLWKIVLKPLFLVTLHLLYPHLTYYFIAAYAYSRASRVLEMCLFENDLSIPLS